MTDFSRQTLTIATRESPLALWQAQHIAARMRAMVPGLQVELLGMTTQGDKLLAGPLATSGGKGLFVKELELALLDGRADLAVHSAKDMPAQLPEGLVLIAVGPRAEVRDALVLPAPQGNTSPPSIAGIDGLREGAIVGTASQRRLCQLRRLRPDLDCRPLRGNVNTRLGKLDHGEFDAIVLAAAGLQRLDFTARISALLPIDAMLPAPAQGALAVECRSGDTALITLLKRLGDASTTLCVAAERALSAQLEGGCQLPIAALAQLEDGHNLVLQALVGSLDGKRSLTHKAYLCLSDGRHERVDATNIANAAQLGREVANVLLARGAAELISAHG
ncbi:MAG: hydroxymethylbilane synthase [Pseudomonadales bacterium]